MASGISIKIDDELLRNIHIRAAQKGVCLFKCGNERYLLEVHAPDHIRVLFGEAGGR